MAYNLTIGMAVLNNERGKYNMANFTTADRIGGIGGYIGGISALLGNGILGNWGGMTENDRPISRYEMDMVREIIDEKQKNAILVSENDTEKKMVEVYNALAKQDKEIRATIEANYKEQNKINMDQAVYNGVNTATLNCMQSRIEELLALTARRIPNTSVCPGWGEVTVAPVTPT